MELLRYTTAILLTIGYAWAIRQMIRDSKEWKESRKRTDYYETEDEL
jgi:hypothetical protein